MSTQAYRELTMLETELRAAIRADAPTISDPFRRYVLAGGCMNLADIDDEERNAKGKRPHPLNVVK